MIAATPVIQKVAVYFNLHKKVFSIKALNGPFKGRVIGHSDYVELENCTFKVSEAGRQRVLREKRKNVHAYVVGDLVGIDEQPICGEAATYNPYKFSTFVRSFNEEPLHKANTVQMKAENNRGRIYFR
jgi:hypothetical protein